MFTEGNELQGLEVPANKQPKKEVPLAISDKSPVADDFGKSDPSVSPNGGDAMWGVPRSER